MSSRLPFASLALVAGLSLFPLPSFSEIKTSSDFKVLGSQETGFNVAAVEELIKKGDASIQKRI